MAAESSMRPTPPPVFIVTRNYAPATGGIETLASELVAHAARTGVRVVLVHIGQKRFRPDASVGVEDAVVYHHLPGTHRFAALLVSLLTLPFLIAFHRPRYIVHMQVTTAPGSWLATRLPGLARIPYFVMAMGLEVLPSHDAWLMRIKALALRGARRIVSISRFTDGLVARFGIAPERRAVVLPGTRFWPPPTAAQTRERLFGSGADGRFVCLSLSRLVPRKGMDTALEAVARVVRQRKDILYCIAGSGPDLPRLQSIAAEKGLQDHVRFLGRIPEDEVGAAYAQADLFVLLSRETRDPPAVEGFGIVFLEAAACGTPSLAGASGGVPDAVVDGGTGFLVDPLDARAVADKILLLMEDRALLERLGDNALEHARASAWEKACARYFAVFNA
jgi:phosphatidylinositol alpha-1,6-mannosyltransferase